jgi:formate-dependent nitrite reductase membrane component NrfD
MAEHFVAAPHWEWYILGYFFLGGLSGGMYTLATMLRLWGSPRDEAAARTAFLAAFPLLVLCPILLTIDLGRPLRFWHMLIDTTPGHGGLAFKYWSPMSVGSWALLLYGAFALVSFIEVRTLDGRMRAPLARAIAHALAGGAGRVVNGVGALLGLYVASYTGILLSVSNQPIWSDTWALGGLFLASGLGGSAALLAWLARYRPEGEATEWRLAQMERYFAILELLLIAVVFANLAGAGTLTRALAKPWGVLWALVVASLVPPLVGMGGPAIQVASGSGSAAVARVAGASRTPMLASVLLGVLLMRFAVIWSAQF